MHSEQIGLTARWRERCLAAPVLQPIVGQLNFALMLLFERAARISASYMATAFCRPGGHSEETSPDPIPNSAVKLLSADGTASYRAAPPRVNADVERMRCSPSGCPAAKKTCRGRKVIVSVGFIKWHMPEPVRHRGFISRNQRLLFATALCRPGSDLLSHALRRSTIGAEEFNGRVRNGIG